MNILGTSRGSGGSAISTAVASTVLVTTNDPGKFDEYTARTVAPSSPDIRDVTSAAAVGFCFQINLMLTNVQFSNVLVKFISVEILNRLY